VIYRERLHVPWWWVLIAALFVLSLAVAVYAYVDPLIATVFTVLAAVGVGLALVAYSATTVGVVDGAVVAGRNRVSLDWVAGADPLGGETARAALGRDANHRDFLLTRPYVPGLVRIRLSDPADPHPAWLVSTRRPEDFAAAVNAPRNAG